MRSRAVAATLALALALIGGCEAGATSPLPTRHPAALDDTTWTIESAQGRRSPAGDVTIWFGEAEVSGSSGCNRFSTSVLYEASTGRVRFGPAISSTKKACTGPEGVFEGSFVQALLGATVATLDQEGRLVLEGTGGSIVLLPSDRPHPTD